MHGNLCLIGCIRFVSSQSYVYLLPFHCSIHGVLIIFIDTYIDLCRYKHLVYLQGSHGVQPLDVQLPTLELCHYRQGFVWGGRGSPSPCTQKIVLSIPLRYVPINGDNFSDQLQKYSRTSELRNCPQ